MKEKENGLKNSLTKMKLKMNIVDDTDHKSNQESNDKKYHVNNKISEETDLNEKDKNIPIKDDLKVDATIMMDLNQN